MYFCFRLDNLVKRSKGQKGWEMGKKTANSICGVGLLRFGYGDILHAYSILYEYILPASPLYTVYALAEKILPRVERLRRLDQVESK